MKTEYTIYLYLNLSRHLNLNCWHLELFIFEGNFLTLHCSSYYKPISSSLPSFKYIFTLLNAGASRVPPDSILYSRCRGPLQLPCCCGPWHLLFRKKLAFSFCHFSVCIYCLKPYRAKRADVQRVSTYPGHVRNHVQLESSAHCPGRFKPGQLAALQLNEPEWSTLRSFHCNHIWTQMLGHVNVAFFIPTSILFLVEHSSNILSI